MAMYKVVESNSAFVDNGFKTTVWTSIAAELNKTYEEKRDVFDAKLIVLALDHDSGDLVNDK